MTRRAALATISAPLFAQTHLNEDAEIMKALDAFMNGWNSGDVAKYADALHFPHLILDGGRYFEYSNREDFVAKGKAHWDRVPNEWHHSVWEERRIVQRLGDTAHVAGRWARKDSAGRVFQRADVVYVVFKKEGRWKIFARSGSRETQRSQTA